MPGTDDEAQSYVPDAPFQTSSMETVVTIGGSQPTVTTTWITYLTAPPAPITSPAVLPPNIVVISGTTYTMTVDAPYTGNKARDVEQGQSPKTAAATGAATPTTLAKGQYWIRAVEAPNFHKYLQTSQANTPGNAILASYKTACQFNIVDGQLVESTGDAPLYMNVEKPTDLTQRTLATWFNATKNTFGTFVFSGDAVTWSTPEIKRQNLAAWLVCKNSGLFINTGAYAYQTPAGCADETVRWPLPIPHPTWLS